MPTLSITLTQTQYDRYKAALKKVQGLEVDPTDFSLIAQMIREAAAITYESEVKRAKIDDSNWVF